MSPLHLDGGSPCRLNVAHVLLAQACARYNAGALVAPTSIPMTRRVLAADRSDRFVVPTLRAPLSIVVREVGPISLGDDCVPDLGAPKDEIPVLDLLAINFRLVNRTDPYKQLVFRALEGDGYAVPEVRVLPFRRLHRDNLDFGTVAVRDNRAALHAPCPILVMVAVNRLEPPDHIGSTIGTLV
eukprot:CAMPEP_0115371602 /NCGR_PEP_ID=MMETSP0271-20121206/470_1 /TAXON_ID=71861 /ORGANISM="Scrippsiella trochoidea, Strain CCMP3099" /LENGTH=183 /DNA_ID=CAMNT_0002794517 /DNA_START=180 /DNA_END=731 /DNA_ORIENTATION=-